MVRQMVGPSVGNLFFSNAKNGQFLYENHWGSPSLTWMNVFNVLNVLKMPQDPSLACWASHSIIHAYVIQFIILNSP